MVHAHGDTPAAGISEPTHSVYVPFPLADEGSCSLE